MGKTFKANKPEARKFAKDKPAAKKSAKPCKGKCAKCAK